MLTSFLASTVNVGYSHAFGVITKLLCVVSIFTHYVNYTSLYPFFVIVSVLQCSLLAFTVLISSIIRYMCVVDLYRFAAFVHIRTYVYVYCIALYTLSVSYCTASAICRFNFVHSQLSEVDTDYNSSIGVHTGM
jgi:hypothetical protein